jgi:hypothetical protein
MSLWIKWLTKRNLDDDWYFKIMMNVTTPYKPYGKYVVKKRRNVFRETQQEYALYYDNWVLDTWEHEPTDIEIKKTIELVERAWEVLFNRVRIDISFPIPVKYGDDMYTTDY